MRVQGEAVTMEVTISLAHQACLHPSSSMLVDLRYPERRSDHRMELQALVCRKVLGNALGYSQHTHPRTGGHRLSLAINGASAFGLPMLKRRLETWRLLAPPFGTL
jgi:hypothetical protein